MLSELSFARNCFFERTQQGCMCEVGVMLQLASFGSLLYWPSQMDTCGRNCSKS